jgi:DNA-binding CsgD family transcriptional regulator
MSMGAIGRVLSDALRISLSRRVLRKLHEDSQGNPLLALELGRLLVAGEVREDGGELILPDVADDIFGVRVRESGDSLRRVLLAVALAGVISMSELTRFIDPGVIDEAVAAGLVVIDGSRVRAAHPLLAAAARRHADPGERRELHLELASAAVDPILRATHMAIVTTTPDAALAEVTAAAADLAAGHGRVWEAVTLGAHAMRLTPPGDAAYSERILALARFHASAGDFKRMTTLLRARMSEIPPGRQRAFALLMVCDGSDIDLDSVEGVITDALAEDGQDPDVQAWALVMRVDIAGARLERLDEAQLWVRKAAALVRSSESGLERIAPRVRAALAWTSVLRGRPIEELMPSEGAAPHWVVVGSIDRAQGVRFAFRGQLDLARAVFNRLIAVAEERGELHSIAAITLQRCEVELRAGHLREVAYLLGEFEGVLPDALPAQGGSSPYHPRLRALAAAVAGDAPEAGRWAARILQREGRPVNQESPGWDRLETQRALGIAALFDRDSASAVEQLSQVWDHTRREHVDDPGAFPVAGDLVEALVQSGRYDEATAVLEHLGALAREQDHPWGLATTQRGESLVQLARADVYIDAAADGLTEAAHGYGELGLDFDRARTLLSLGVIQRRFKRRGAARTSLEQAADAFERWGSSGWANRARDELDRVSGRRSAPNDRLTPTEQRVASLAVQGLTNKEIASQLVVSVNTVQGHLSRAYAKLGVRSRGQLAQHLAGSFGQ